MKFKVELDDFDCFIKGQSEIYLKGRVYFEDIKLSIDEILEFLEKDSVSFINKITGLFSFVYINNNKLIACVDIIRSLPLFYDFDIKRKALRISSSANELVVGRKKSLINEDVFKLCSYVLGNETLYEGVFQLVAGSYLLFDNNNLKKIEYFSFKTENSHDFDYFEFKDKFISILEKNFKQLLEYANGRQLVVPLSGGYDSRLIVCMLKKLKYENVICFSYGVKNNKEALYSQIIAKEFDYKWIFVEYTRGKWKSAWNSKLAQQYVSFSSNRVSLPHIQDWLAIKELKENNLIDGDAIFLPGHCCVTGYITKSILSIKDSKPEEVVKILIDQHFNLVPLNTLKFLNNYQLLQKFINKKIKYDYENNNIISNIILFNWKERQSKYIANSLRVYEFFQYEWWMPLWDKDFAILWKKVPDNERVDRVVYKKIVDEQFEFLGGSIKISGNANRPHPLRKFFNIIFSKNNIVGKIIERIYREKQYTNHPLAFDALVKESELKEKTLKGYSIIGIYNEKFINNEWFIK